MAKAVFDSFWMNLGSKNDVLFASEEVVFLNLNICLDIFGIIVVVWILMLYGRMGFLKAFPAVSLCECLKRGAVLDVVHGNFHSFSTPNATGGNRIHDVISMHGAPSNDCSFGRERIPWPYRDNMRLRGQTPNQQKWPGGKQRKAKATSSYQTVKDIQRHNMVKQKTSNLCTSPPPPPTNKQKLNKLFHKKT